MVAIVSNNLRNKQLENNDTLMKLWLTLLRYYPSLPQQAAMGIDLTRLNQQMKSLFDQNYKLLQEDNEAIYIEVIE